MGEACLVSQRELLAEPSLLVNAKIKSAYIFLLPAFVRLYRNNSIMCYRLILPETVFFVYNQLAVNIICAQILIFFWCCIGILLVLYWFCIGQVLVRDWTRFGGMPSIGRPAGRTTNCCADCF